MCGRRSTGSNWTEPLDLAGDKSIGFTTCRRLGMPSSPPNSAAAVCGLFRVEGPAPWADAGSSGFALESADFGGLLLASAVAGRWLATSMFFPAVRLDRRKSVKRNSLGEQQRLVRTILDLRSSTFYANLETLTGEALAELGRILKTRKLFGRVDVKDVGVDSLAVVHGGAAK